MATTLLDGIRMGDTATPYVAAADGALRAAGMWDDEVWMLLGLSGLGFHLVVDPGTCPSSPTAYDWSQAHTAAMQRVAVSSRCVECVHDTEQFESLRATAVDLIKQSLDRGVPAVVRTFDYAEFAVVTGYDDADEVFFLTDVTGDADPVLYTNLGKPHGSPMLFAQVFTGRGAFDLRRAAIDSLEYAVDCWRGQGFPESPIYRYRVGAEGYQALIHAVDQADTDPLGLRYIVRVLADARAGIAKYVARLHEEAVLPGLAAPAELYASVAEALARVAELLPAAPPYERPLEREVLPEASALLQESAGTEERAIGEVERILHP